MTATEDRLRKLAEKMYDCQAVTADIKGELIVPPEVAEAEFQARDRVAKFWRGELDL